MCNKKKNPIQPDESESSEEDLASARQCSRTTFESDAWHTRKIKSENLIPVIAEVNNTKRPSLPYQLP